MQLPEMIYFTLLLPLIVADPLSQEENQKLQATCGKRSATPIKRFQRSMNTPEVKRNEAPWAVLLKFAKDWNSTLDQTEQFNNSSVTCSGTLISSRHVLTAAHCFGPLIEPACGLIENKTNADGDKYRFAYKATFHRRNLERILLAAPDRCTDKTCKSHINSNGVKINKVFISTEFILEQCMPKVYGHFAGDIAIIELEEDVKFSETVQPACLPDKFGLPEGENLTMYGYGVDHEQTSLGILRRHEAQVQECIREENHDSDLVCSNHPTALACSGDSGSGQIIFNNGTAHVSGVMVAGKPCWLVHLARKENPDLPAQNLSVVVSHHINWICKVSGICRDSMQFNLNLKWIAVQIMYPMLDGVSEPEKYLTLEKLTGNDLYA